MVQLAAVVDGVRHEGEVSIETQQRFLDACQSRGRNPNFYLGLLVNEDGAITDAGVRALTERLGYA